jgi:hypothetical protein
MGRIPGLHIPHWRSPAHEETKANRASEEPAHGADSMSEQEHKGYNNKIQEKVFHGSIIKINVTLIELSRQLYSLELSKQLRELRVKQNILYW